MRALLLASATLSVMGAGVLWWARRGPPHLFLPRKSIGLQILAMGVALLASWGLFHPVDPRETTRLVLLGFVGVGAAVVAVKVWLASKKAFRQWEQTPEIRAIREETERLKRETDELLDEYR